MGFRFKQTKNWGQREKGMQNYEVVLVTDVFQWIIISFLVQGTVAEELLWLSLLVKITKSLLPAWWPVQHISAVSFLGGSCFHSSF
jgi:hypothetical protein